MTRSIKVFSPRTEEKNVNVLFFQEDPELKRTMSKRYPWLHYHNRILKPSKIMSPPINSNHPLLIRTEQVNEKVNYTNRNINSAIENIDDVMKGILVFLNSIESLKRNKVTLSQLSNKFINRVSKYSK